jgi:hypothetical protein
VAVAGEVSYTQRISDTFRGKVWPHPDEFCGRDVTAATASR